MDRNHDGRRNLILAIALVAALGALAACTDDAALGSGDGGPIGTQASGKFSSGSLFSGSINGEFTVVGIGSAGQHPHDVEFEVEGTVWFTCVNKGGNEAPGQFDFVLDDTDQLDANDRPDRSGRYETDTLTVDITHIPDTACTRNENWRVKKDSSGDAITYLDPHRIYAFLWELDADGNRIQDAADELVWDCTSLPNPTYPLEDMPLPDLEAHCELIVGSL